MAAQNCTLTTYLEQRLAALGLSPDDAAIHGLRDDGRGNVEQIIRNFTGRPVLWLDKRGGNLRQIDTINNRRTFTENGGGLERFHRELSIIRYSPENLAAIRRTKPDAPKYRFAATAITGHGVYPMPTNAAINAYNSGQTGGVAIGIEGYLKAVSLAVNGAEATAFTGISTYKVDEHLADYLLQRRPDNFIILYDADALQLPEKNAEVVDTGRVFNFYASARNFAAQFHNFRKATGLKTRLHFAMVAEGCNHKGVDDLLEASGAEERPHIIDALHTLETSKWFTFLRLGSSNYEKRLAEFFGVKTHVAFYRQYNHIIGERPFRFGGAVYQSTIPPRHFNLFNRKNAATSFRLLTDPHAVEMEVEVEAITVERHMEKATRQLDNAIRAHGRICIDAPTGTGKTAFFLGYHANRRRHPGYFKRTGTRGIIAVPTVLLAKQLAAKYKVPALHGYVTAKIKTAVLNAPVAICTYDNLRHVDDLATRILVVDEAHNLVGQYGEIKENRPFRAETLRRIVERFNLAAKTILISGTPPQLLAKHYGFHYVEVQRRQNNRVHVHAMEAENSGYKALTTAVLAELTRINWNDGNIHFVFFNHREQLELIRKHLVTSGHLAADDVAIITREHVMDGNHRIFNEIATREEITGAKLILSTCLIAEGVNINNRNIGRIYTVGINCPDLFRQYVARFRNMENLTVYSIRPPETRLDNAFFKPATAELEDLLILAENQRQLVERKARQHAAEYPEEILPWLDEVQPRYYFRPEIYPFVYSTDDGGVAADELRIFAAIRERILEASNNVWFYSEIGRHPNIIIQGAETDVAMDTRAEIAAAIKDTAAAMKEQKEAALSALRNDLRERPEVVVGAYYLRVKKAGNRHATARVEAMAGGLLPVHGEAAAYLVEHAEWFHHKWFTKTINRFLRLYLVGVDDDTMASALVAGYEDFNRAWLQWETWMEFCVYDNRRLRYQLEPRHQLEIKTRRMMAGWIEAAAADGVVRSDKLTQYLNGKLKRRQLTAAMDGVEETPVAILKEADTERNINAMFVVEEHVFHGYKEYHILRPVEEPPFTGTCTPEDYVKSFVNR